MVERLSAARENGRVIHMVGTRRDISASKGLEATATTGGDGI